MQINGHGRDETFRYFALGHLTIVDGFIHGAFGWLIALGIFGPLLLGIADSSFLVLPFGNDILIVYLTASHPGNVWFYVPLAAIGSTLGVLLLDIVCRKGGEEGLRKMMKPKRFDYFKQKISKGAAYAVAIACIAPPPFPFTLVIASASAFEYPRLKLLSVVLVTRAIRFAIVGFLAIEFGRGILKIAKSPITEWAMIGFIVLCVVASVFEVIKWLRRSKRGAEVAA